MSTEPPPGSGPPPPPGAGPPPPPPGSGPPPPPGGPPPHYGGGPYGGDSYGGPYPADPLAGMPPLADSGKRTLARIVDLILVTIVIWLVTWPLQAHQYTVNANRVEFGKPLTEAVVSAVLYIAYDTFMISRTGQTLGKKWLNMRVANLADGTTPSVQTSLGRAAVLWLPFCFCCACIWLAICGGWSFIDRPYKQGLHDKAAKTVVVSTS
ncbi:RDD family protein [Streptomyces sp. NPDC046197]|uniref:RDD family protein n=1 Tax=Streptomyces sp. NPDC046197 TaxID=3154337 RepID=UPI0033E26044